MMKTLIEAGSQSEASWLHGRKTKPGDALTSKTKDTKCAFQTWTLERACCNALDDALGVDWSPFFPLNLGRLPHGIWDVFVEIQGYIQNGSKWHKMVGLWTHECSSGLKNPAIVYSLMKESSSTARFPIWPLNSWLCCLMWWWFLGLFL